MQGRGVEGEETDTGLGGRGMVDSRQVDSRATGVEKDTDLVGIGSACDLGSGLDRAGRLAGLVDSLRATVVRLGSGKACN